MTTLASFRAIPVAAEAFRVLAVTIPPVWLIAPVVAASEVVVPDTAPVRVKVPDDAVRLAAVPPLIPLAEKPPASVKLNPVVAVKGPTAPTALALFSVDAGLRPSRSAWRR